MPMKTTRRERVRDATMLEIKSTARRLLVDEGPDALTLRAIAREMGMTAPALYRYFASHEALVGALTADVLDELTAEIARARDEVPPGDPVGRLAEACRAFRRWALAHPREFQLSFASPLPDGFEALPAGGSPDDLVEGMGFGGVFLGIFVELWQQRPFAVPEEDELGPGLVRQLERFRTAVGEVLPIGALHAYLADWVRLYGAVTVEVFGHLGFALDDPEPMFEAMLADMGRQLSVPATS
ncbi:MAG: TetR/AcrR family transcriptional regulator [Actinomycetes bacterium]